MTFAPLSLVQLQGYLEARGVDELGVVGDTRHLAGYHLGRDRIYGPTGEGDDDYSVQLPRDRAGLSDAASAIDVGRVGGSLAALQQLSRRLVVLCQAGAPGAADVREVIYSPDGVAVQRWSGVDGQIHTGPGNGDLSHRTHTHVSYYRDAEARDKVGLWRAALEVQAVTIRRIKGEGWTLRDGQPRPLRSRPERSNAAIVATIPGDAVLRTVAEVTGPAGDDWRLGRWSGITGYLLRSDLDPDVQGGDPAVDAALGDFLAGLPVQRDCRPELDALQAAWLAWLSRPHP